MTSNAMDPPATGGPVSDPPAAAKPPASTPTAPAAATTSVAGAALSAPAEAPAAPPAPVRGNNVDDIVIGAGVVSTGNFVTRGLICVDGTLRESALEADVISISQGAEFQGTARARQVEVFGRIEGELVATEQLVLRASAHVIGKISSPCMVMHRGATVTGEVETLGFDARRIHAACAASAQEAVAAD